MAGRHILLGTDADARESAVATGDAVGLVDGGLDAALGDALTPDTVEHTAVVAGVDLELLMELVDVSARLTAALIALAFEAGSVSASSLTAFVSGQGSSPSWF